MASLSTGEPGHRSVKGMRLGTRSCAECRRRKVRCIYTGQGQSCRNCILHGTQCQSQQPKETASRDKDNVQQRLDKLEGLLRNLSEAVYLEDHPPRLEDLALDLSRALQTIRSPSVLGDKQGAADEIEAVEYAPLIKLFQEAMTIQTIPETSYGYQSLSHDLRIIVEALRALLPAMDDVTLILEGTVDYWSLWWTWPGFPLSVGDQTQPESLVTAARDFISQSMQSDRPIIIARGALWLALCIQQSPLKLRNRQTKAPAPLGAVFDCYLQSVDKLLKAETDSRASLERVECLMLCTKLYINMGRPRKAWLSTRSAIDAALLIGLHRPEVSGEREEALWSQVWQTDRQLSLILGFPYAVPDSYLGPRKPLLAQSAAAQVMRNLSIIAGRIGERNQSYQTTDYATTFQIEQELLHCQYEMPTEWWDPISYSKVSLKVLYSQSACKIYFFQLLKTLHLPYMLKSSEDEAFEHSRISVLHACREMIKSFDILRESNMAAILICGLMDFQVFSAGVVIILNLLSQEPNRDTSEDANDWVTIQSLIKKLQCLSESMDCTVAAQAANLLKHLFMASQGEYTAMEDYEAEIPYFGKVRISRTKGVWPQSESTSPGSSLGNSAETVPSWTVANSMIEFNANYFTSCSQNPIMEYPYDKELGIDWTTTFDLNSAYDWSQLFYSTSTG